MRACRRPAATAGLAVAARVHVAGVEEVVLPNETDKATARNERFRQLQKMFIGAAADDVSEMAELLDRYGESVPEGDAGDRFRKLAHDLRGTGGGYEFPAISDTAAELEDAYLAESSAEILKQSLVLLRRAVESARAQLEPVLANAAQ